MSNVTPSEGFMYMLCVYVSACLYSLCFCVALQVLPSLLCGLDMPKQEVHQSGVRHYFIHIIIELLKYIPLVISLLFCVGWICPCKQEVHQSGVRHYFNHIIIELLKYVPVVISLLLKDCKASHPCVYVWKRWGWGWGV